MDVQLPDGTLIQGVPDGTTKAMLAEKLQAKGMKVPPEWLKPASAAPTKPPSSLEAARSLVAPTGAHGAVEEAVGEPAAAALTGLASSAAGGVAGIARGLGTGAAALARGEGAGAALDAGAQEFTDTLHRVQEAGTYHPKFQTGKAVTETINKPFRWLAGKAGQAGTAVGETIERGAETMGASRETARRIGGTGAALTETAVQAAPAALTGVAGRAWRALSADDATLAARGAQVGEVPRGTSAKPEGPGRPGEAPGTGQPPPPGAQQGGATAQPRAENSPEARAQAYAVRIGLDWSRLGTGTRAALTQIARDARALDRLDPAAVQRQAHLEGLRVPVPATRGQLTRDPVQLRREAVVSNVAEGQPIRDVDVAANRAVQANLEALRGRAAAQRGGLHEPVTPEGTPAATPSIRAPTKLPTQVGSSVQTALRGSAARSKASYKELYKKARETEPTARVPLTPVTDLLTENPAIQHLGWVNSWLNKAAKAAGGKEGEPVALTHVTLNELDDLHKLAVKYGKAGGTDGHYATLLKEQIDRTMEAAPEAAKAWKAATSAFREHKRQFADQKLVRDLVEQKKGTAANRALALERTWSTVAKGSREDLLTVKSSLMRAGPAGRRAWNDLRGETVNRILEDARNVTARDETERQILTEAALRRSVNSVPRENLRELLGPNLLRELDNIVRARAITTRSPISGRTTQSGTVPNALVMAEKLLSHIPGGTTVTGTIRALGKARELGEAARTAREATRTPLGTRATAAMEDLERGGGTLGAAPTIGEAVPQARPQPPPP